jgi:hypothetical protein
MQWQTAQCCFQVCSTETRISQILLLFVREERSVGRKEVMQAGVGSDERSHVVVLVAGQVNRQAAFRESTRACVEKLKNPSYTEVSMC